LTMTPNSSGTKRSRNETTKANFLHKIRTNATCHEHASTCMPRARFAWTTGDGSDTTATHSGPVYRYRTRYAATPIQKALPKANACWAQARSKSVTFHMSRFKQDVALSSWLFLVTTNLNAPQRVTCRY
jgi:hypothetical protein